MCITRLSDNTVDDSFLHEQVRNRYIYVGKLSVSHQHVWITCEVIMTFNLPDTDFLHLSFNQVTSLNSSISPFLIIRTKPARNFLIIVSSVNNHESLQLPQMIKSSFPPSTSQMGLRNQHHQINLTRISWVKLKRFTHPSFFFSLRIFTDLTQETPGAWRVRRFFQNLLHLDPFCNPYNGTVHFNKTITVKVVVWTSCCRLLFFKSWTNFLFWFWH